MKSWKKALRREIEETVENVKLSEEVLNASVPQKRSFEEYKKPSFGNFLTPKRLVAFLTAFIALCIAVVPVAVMAKNSVASVSCEVLLEINPSVLFVTDKNGVVTAVKSVNSDADVILYDSEFTSDLIGKPLSKGCELFIDKASRLGFVDFESKENAVKLTSQDETDFLKESKSGLEKYFCDKGVYSAVLTEISDVKSFADKIGISAYDKKSLKNQTEKMSVLYGERDVGDIEKAYNENVLTGLYGIVKSKVSTIIDGASLILKMKVKNLEIKAHPFMIGKDYWDIKDENVEDLPILSTLKLEMATLIAEYTKLTDGKCQMRTRWEFETALRDYSALVGDGFDSSDEKIDEESYLGGLISYFSTLTLDKFYCDDEKLLAVLFKTDIDAMGYETLITAPTSVKEYHRELVKVLSGLSTSREKNNKDVYEAQRQSVSDEAYADYINKIVEDYGSLDNFWKKIK